MAPSGAKCAAILVSGAAGSWGYFSGSVVVVDLLQAPGSVAVVDLLQALGSIAVVDFPQAPGSVAGAPPLADPTPPWKGL